MPAVSTNAHVLVSGASGFIAVHIVKELLDRGFKVRGTVRSAEKGDYLKNKFSSGNFEYVIAEDLEKEGVFDDAVKDIDAVLHTASPFHFNVEDPYKDLVNPAVNGTESILKSIKKNGSKVQRVVITSSFAAVLDSSIPPVHTFTEKDWNEYSPAQLKEKGKDVSPPDAYRASKTLAEKAAWNFVEKENPQFDIVTINPPLVIGPVLHQITKPDSLNTSVNMWYAYLSGKKSAEGAEQGAGNEVDVRDLAHAHIQSILIEEAGNNRFAITNQPFTWQQALDVVADNQEIKQTFSKLPTGQKGAGDNAKQHIYDGTKSKQILKLQYTPFDKTIVDMSLSLAEREKSGWSSSV